MRLDYLPESHLLRAVLFDDLTKALEAGRLMMTRRLAGYDYVLSMEHEDSLMSLREGLEKGVGALRELVLTDERGKPWFDS